MNEKITTWLEVAAVALFALAAAVGVAGWVGGAFGFAAGIAAAGTVFLVSALGIGALNDRTDW